MRQRFALVWLLCVVAAGIYLGIGFVRGFSVQGDLLALLPREERDPIVQQANEAIARNLGRRVLLLVGAKDREQARSAAKSMLGTIGESNLIDFMDQQTFHEMGRKLATFYYTHGAAGDLLSPSDRQALEGGHAAEIANRAVAQTFGFGSPVDARLLKSDPFLLLPSFLTSLPVPFARLRLDDGLLSIVSGERTWIVLVGTLRADAFNLEAQRNLVSTVDQAIEKTKRIVPDVEILRLGMVFFAEHGARTGIDEASTLSSISIAASVILILCVFRRLMPLLLNLLAIGVGVLTAFAATFLIFGGIHAVALLFGTSLIGVVIDYGLLYSTLAFRPERFTGPQKLSFVMPSISLGLATALMGYTALALAPFPGLRQIAVFAVVGLVGAFITVVAWFPILDRGEPLQHGKGLRSFAMWPWVFWFAPRLRQARIVVILLYPCLLIAGLVLMRTNDDVRRLQAMSPELVHEQTEIRDVVGISADTQYLLVSVADDEAALELEEALAPRLDRLVLQGTLTGYQMPASYVPSLRRQIDNQRLVRDRLYEPLLKSHLARLGLTGGVSPASSPARFTLKEAEAAEAIPLLSEQTVASGAHIIVLQGLTDAGAVSAAIDGLSGVRLVNPTADFSSLLGRYRGRSLWFATVSLALVVGMMLWRYGRRGVVWATLPPLIATLSVPAGVTFTGEPFTFFHAIGLLLVIGIGADYSIFCAETREGNIDTTMLSILLAALMTLLSFGLLIASSTLAVRAFGVTMLIGVTTAYLMAPLAFKAASWAKAGNNLRA